jgi:2-phospho-L-lactate guanylyltransferase
MKALLIPVKDPQNSKTRLSSLLSLEERRRLAWTMFEDASRAVADSRQADLIVLVTSFAPAIERARALGWEVLIEPSQVSESASVDWASHILDESGFDVVMRLPADLPLVEAEDIDAVLSIDLKSPGALLIPSRDGTGTNAIIRTPPNLFPSRFGPNSFSLHKGEAARAGVECMIVNNASIALDIDEPADVELFIKSGKGKATFDALIEMGVPERLKAISREDDGAARGIQR